MKKTILNHFFYLGFFLGVNIFHATVVAEPVTIGNFSSHSLAVGLLQLCKYCQNPIIILNDHKQLGLKNYFSELASIPIASEESISLDLPCDYSFVLSVVQDNHRDPKKAYFFPLPIIEGGDLKIGIDDLAEQGSMHQGIKVDLIDDKNDTWDSLTQESCLRGVDNFKSQWLSTLEKIADLMIDDEESVTFGDACESDQSAPSDSED